MLEVAVQPGSGIPGILAVETPAVPFESRKPAAFADVDRCQIVLEGWPAFFYISDHTRMYLDLSKGLCRQKFGLELPLATRLYRNSKGHARGKCEWPVASDNLILQAQAGRTPARGHLTVCRSTQPVGRFRTQLQPLRESVFHFKNHVAAETSARVATKRQLQLSRVFVPNGFGQEEFFDVGMNRQRVLSRSNLGSLCLGTGPAKKKQKQRYNCASNHLYGRRTKIKNHLISPILKCLGASEVERISRTINAQARGGLAPSDGSRPVLSRSSRSAKEGEADLCYQSAAKRNGMRRQGTICRPRRAKNSSQEKQAAQN